MDPGLPFGDLLAYNADETKHWKRCFGENAAALDLACDVAGAGSVRNLAAAHFRDRAVLREPRARVAEGRPRQPAPRHT